MKETDKTTNKTTKQTGGKGKIKPRWKPGESGNPKGRPKGRKNFGTLFEEAIRKIAKEKRLKITDPEVEIVVKAVAEALKGNYSYYRDIMDRKFGKPKEKMDITSGGKVIKGFNYVRGDNPDHKTDNQAG